MERYHDALSEKKAVYKIGEKMHTGREDRELYWNVPMYHRVNSTYHWATE